MQQYVVTKTFSIGELGKTLLTAQTILFDGAALIIGDQTFSAPTLAAAVRKGWLIPSGTAEFSTRSVEPSKTVQPLSNQKYEVVEHGSSDPNLPAKKPRPLLDLSMPVISDAEEDISIDEALPSLKMRKKAREALRNKSDETIPQLDVKSDGGEVTQLNRKPMPTKRNLLDTMPLVDTKVSVPQVEPRNVFGGTELNEQNPNTLQSDDSELFAAKPSLDSTTKIPQLPVVEENNFPNVEVLESPKSAEVEAKTSRRKVKKVDSGEETKILASSIGAEALVHPMSDGVPHDWKKMSFRDRKNFVEENNNVAVLKALLVVEKGAVKKFITSKLEALS